MPRDTIALDLLSPSAGGEAPAPGPLGLPARYEERGFLAAGGMGEVHRVRDRHLGSSLVVKLLKERFAQDAGVRGRFLAEARLTAQLNHPAIVAVQDQGELPDGRLWFVMQEVVGRTMGEVIAALHEGSGPEAWGEAGRWTFRGLVDALGQVCEAVGYAHSRGVIHRDLKPDNVMLGDFGEVRVMDWGLARVPGQDESSATGFDLPATGATALGQVMGTPGYLSPEQARGELSELGPASDVYALGALLYALLSGVAPFSDQGPAGWMRARSEPPTRVERVGTGRHPPLPEELVAICEQAMDLSPEGRYFSAAELAEDIERWLEGARRREQALVQVEEARAKAPLAATLRAEAEALEQRAREALEGVALHAPLEDKLPGWRLEQAAAARRREARRAELEVVQRLRGALSAAPDLAPAHALLADHYKARLEAAEARHDADAAAEAELLLRAHDRGQHAAWLRGHGAVTLLTDPPGARVRRLRVVEQDRCLVEVDEGELGATPLREATLERGSWVLLIEKEGHEPVRYPVKVGRLEHWHGLPPGASAPQAIHLPRRGELSVGERYVPAGWFQAGGDPDALDSLPAMRVWVDGFVMMEHPVTWRGWLRFLQDRLARGEGVEGLLPEAGGEGLRSALERTPGGWRLGAVEGHALRLDEPALWLTGRAADAYAAWRSARSGQPWRLPHDLEWEKCARGVDGRSYPWGEHLDPSWCRMQSSLAGEPSPALIHEHPADVSVYGVRGLGGNARDWCLNGYLRGGLPEGARRVAPTPAGEDEPYRMHRGGCWASSANNCRAAGRLVGKPDHGASVVGLRLCRSAAGP